MATACRYENDEEEKRHFKAILMLAEDLGLPEAEIRSLYEAFFCSISEEARIKDYLVVIVSRNVRDFVRRGQLG